MKKTAQTTVKEEYKLENIFSPYDGNAHFDFPSIVVLG